MEGYQLSDLLAAHGQAGELYHEFLRVDSMNCGIYVLPAGEPDPQSPHAEDELYYVISGRSRFVSEGDEVDVQPGTAIFVEAGRDHRFVDIEEDLVILVVFAGTSIES